MFTTILEAFAILLIVAGAVSVVIGVALVSVPLAFIIGGLVAVALAFGGLWISKRVSE